MISLLIGGVYTVISASILDSVDVAIHIIAVRLLRGLILTDVSSNEILDYIYKDQRDSIDTDNRWYFVGKLIKQDITGKEPGYRETLKCSLCEKDMQVIGPDHFSSNRFMARCINDKCHASRYRYYGRTVKELWQAMNPAQVLQEQ